MNIKIKEYHFDFGIDPQLHIAHSASKLSAEKPLLRMRFLTGKEQIECELIAKIGKSEINTEDDAYTAAAALLRNCYGKINYFVASAIPSLETAAIIKLLKAFRSDIKVLLATADPSDPAGNLPVELPEQFPLACIDTVRSVSAKDAAAACEEAKETEALSLGAVSGAALYAAMELAKTIQDRHRRIVVFLPD